MSATNQCYKCGGSLIPTDEGPPDNMSKLMSRQEKDSFGYCPKCDLYVQRLKK